MVWLAVLLGHLSAWRESTEWAVEGQDWAPKGQQWLDSGFFSKGGKGNTPSGL